MQGGEKLSLEQIRALLAASQEVRFAGHSRSEVYDWVGKTLREQDYVRQGREAKGVLRTYVAKMTGLSRAQVTRLIGQHMRQGEVKEVVYQRHRFAKHYTPTDAALLAAVDETHDTLSGPATRRILERELVESEENQMQVSHSSHRPWKSLRDSHIPTAAMAMDVLRPHNERKEPRSPLLRFRLILQ